MRIQIKAFNGIFLLSAGCYSRQMFKPDPFFKIHRDSVWSVLAGLATESASSIVIHDVKEIETWILRLLSAPVPIPNSTRIEVCYNLYIICPL